VAQVDSLKHGSSIAIVVPVLDDNTALAALLGAIEAWPEQPAEIIVAAARPDSDVAALCRDVGARLVDADANRGQQLDLGARMASAYTLWFLHADAQPPATALRTIRAAIDAGAEGGCFRFAFQGRPTATKRVLAALVNLRVQLGGIAYGDQGLFARRDVYVAVGGFPHQPLFEEVAFVRALRARGHFRMLQHTLPVAPRRWERDGWWRRTWHNRWLATCYGCGVRVEHLAHAYRRRHGTDT
jgi:rSAM/selenodomain-associated transferase 2